MDIAHLNHLLARTYGDRPWRQHHDPLSVLIATILSQNTSDVNSGRAFNSLVSLFHSWEEVAEASVEDIERTIRSGGLSRTKSLRIKKTLQMILEERGSLDLSFLDSLSVDEARAWLRKLPGVGPKTISCVLLFSLNKPVFPVDTHVFRVAKRLKLLQNGISADRAHEVMDRLVPEKYIYQLHMNMVEHGRRVCRSQNPKCRECVLEDECPSRFIVN